jgi:hypothetical protein
VPSVKGSEEFRGLHRRLRTLVEQQHQIGKVRLLPVSPVQLAREAEQTDEFRRLALRLFRLESEEDSVGDLAGCGKNGIRGGFRLAN